MKALCNKINVTKERRTDREGGKYGEREEGKDEEVTFLRMK